MPRLDESRPFLPVNIALLTVSDSRNAAQDRSGATLADLATAAGHHIAARRIVRDEQAEIVAQLKAWIADPAVDVVVSTGGTGLTGRDVTPEAFRELFDKELEGFTVLWHLVSYATVGVSTMQSRACAGIAGNTVIYVLPGSNGACRDGWDKLISLQIDSRQRPCS